MFSPMKSSPLSATSAALACVLLLVLLEGSVGDIIMTNTTTKGAPPLDSWFDFGTEKPCREFNLWVNSFFFSQEFMKKVENLVNHSEISYYLICYFRDFIAGTIVYWGTASIWHFVIYSLYGAEIFTNNNRPFPTWETLKDQMYVAQWAIFIYAGLPVFSEFLIESGYTKVYFYVSDVGGWGNYFFGLFLYVCFFEMGIYWMHRKLHTVKFLYKHLHSVHHKYNKHETMTPWASIAFHPVDGILQASPYLLFLPIYPVHYFTHIFLLFFSGVWATNIHDSVPMYTEPIMGAAYHTIHHTHYHYNFGQWFIFCDYIFGTLRSRQDLEDMKQASLAAKKAQ